jgi:hypothetical protein
MQTIIPTATRYRSYWGISDIDDRSAPRAVLIRRTHKGWAYNRAGAEEVAQLEKTWARLLGPAKMQQLKALLAELVARLGYQFEGSSVDIATRVPSQRAGS